LDVRLFAWLISYEKYYFLICCEKNIDVFFCGFPHAKKEKVTQYIGMIVLQTTAVME